MSPRVVASEGPMPPGAYIAACQFRDLATVMCAAHGYSLGGELAIIDVDMAQELQCLHVQADLPRQTLLQCARCARCPKDRWGAAALYKRLAAGDIHGSLLQNDRKLTGMPANHFQGGNEVIWGNFPRAPTAPDSLGRFFLM
ncbi:hypothetical protein GGX14DRAFT_406217 [Mycena pura]|uniref:Uncharacterized protein n=1 Tax=Mycena pura TaxID=153505 RepID=A0AAD6UQD4_9AGAR|nr:hypothetical protein GGX14DRAFT_406217 [Mycena pura]